MFDRLMAEAATARGAGAVGGWARVENAACAARLAAMADLLAARLSALGSAERDQWCIDNWDAVSAEIAAAQNVSAGVASGQLLIAQSLRERLPRVGEVFAAGTICYRMVAAVVARTALITATAALAKVDAEIAGQISRWGSLSVAKTDAAIDYWVDHYDPAALRRSESTARDRHIDIHDAADGSGLAYLEALLYAHDTAALDKRLDAMVAAVCAHDPRTTDQRRADAFTAALNGSAHLPCACGGDACAARDTVASPVVVHMIANEDSLSDDTPVRLDGAQDPGPTREELLSMTISEALSPPPPTGPIAACRPAAIIGGGMLPAPLLAATLARTAKIERLVHPGNAAPEPRYRPSAKLATFVRCRDMTCRFPGCDEPADVCDLDHTIAYPGGPTQASNLTCLCRKHHLRKTFWGWRDQQLPDGTVMWTSPGGQHYTTHPGSRLLFPTLCRPTAPVVNVEVPDAGPNRGLMMPRRTQTRAQNRQRRIQELRRLNDDHVTQRNKPPPF